MARTKGQVTPRCTWSVDDDGNYDTTCEEKFIFNDDGPIENGFKFCPYCGLAMRAERVALSARMRPVENQP